jgi:hypothetical protein
VVLEAVEDFRLVLVPIGDDRDLKLTRGSQSVARHRRPNSPSQLAMALAKHAVELDRSVFFLAIFVFERLDELFGFLQDTWFSRRSAGLD